MPNEYTVQLLEGKNGERKERIMKENRLARAKHYIRSRQWQEGGPRNSSGSMRRRSPCVRATRFEK
jgi:hypothetical protein